MAKNVTIELDTRVLDALIRNLDGNVEEAVQKAAFAIEGRAKVKSPVDTGANRASIAVSMKRTPPSVQRFSGVNYVELPTPQDNHTAYVGPTTDYAAGLELGTSRRAATPYLLPAVRETEAEFRKLLGEAVTDGK